MLDGKCVMITGGTGSFGTAMVMHLLKSKVSEIRILSRDETKQEAMRIEYSEPRLKFYIGDVRDRASVDSAMSGVELVFHAAALKQVPSCEFFPIEAVRTNILGSANVIESAIAASVQRVVCLSTDKSVFPINAMGMTKALMEKVAQSAARRLTDSGTIIACVRYGNVMYSRGSVIPLFVHQIRRRVPVTITEPSMTRFMLPLSHAVGLVEFALQHANQGDVFIRKAPACSVSDLASALSQVFDTECKIKIIGMRHGEKIYETLASADEMRHAEDMDDFFRLPMDTRDLNYAKYFTEGDTKEAKTQHYHSHNAVQLDIAEMKQLLLSLPEIQDELKRVRLP